MYFSLTLRTNYEFLNKQTILPVESDDFPLRVGVASLEQSSFDVLVGDTSVLLNVVALEVDLLNKYNVDV